METTFESSSVNSALTRIKNTLNYSLKENYGIEDPEITEKFLHMHGLDKSRFDFINNFETLIEKGIADESVDTNANKCDKSITGFFVETSLPINKLVGYRYLYRKMKDLYGKKEAKKLSGEMYDLSLAIHDSTNILKPYCYSINASKLVMEGRPFGSLPSGIPHRLNSYVAALAETVHQLSNHLAGAIAIGSYFFDLAHILIYREHKTLSDVLNNEEYRKYIKNTHQAFIHSVNMLSRSAVESPFSNISVFDKPKIRSLIDEDNLGWYFQKEDIIDGIPENALKDCGDKDWKEYIVDIIIQLEDIYLNVMDDGDILHNNRPIEFPVTTLNISRATDKDGNNYFEDPESVDWYCSHDIPRYNLYLSEGQKIASCCRLINDNELFELGGQVNSFGGTALSLGSHRVVTVNFRRIALETNSYEEFKQKLKTRMWDASKILLAHKKLIRDLIDKGTQPFMENGWLDINRMFSTIGMLGYYEAIEDLKKNYGDNIDYLKDILSYINVIAQDITREIEDIIINIEAVPGESAAVRLASTDRWIYGEEKVPEKIYANQFVPLWEDVTIVEKCKREGYTKYLSGGGIAHISCGEKITSKQAKNLLKLMMTSGLEHCAINPCYSICENEHYSLGKLSTCPVCNKPITDFLSRTVGFFIRVSNMSAVKREEDFEKRHYTENTGL